MNTEMQRSLLSLFTRGLFVCVLGVSGITVAAAMTEMEPNDSLSSAQQTPVPAEGLSITGSIGNSAGDPSTDADYFTFEGTAGDTPLIQIVGSLQPDGAGSCAGFPSLLALYDSMGNVRAMSDAECETGTEPRITGSTLPTTGTYTVVVSAYPHWADQDGVLQNMEFATPGGTYVLQISGVRNPNPPAQTPPPVETPPTQTPPVESPPAETPPPVPPVQLPPPSAARQVPIEVRRWHQDERDIEKRRGIDPITVAILTMDGFDATTVNPNTLTFGRTGYEKSLFRCRKHPRDINRDGRMDTVCYFKGDVANFQPGDLNGLLKGKTMSGEQIEGAAALKVYSVPTEKRGFKRHGKRDDRKHGKEKRRN